MKAIARPLLAGLCVAFSMPPWGWWPLTFIGIALYAPLVVHRNADRKSLFLTGLVFGCGWFAPSLVWMVFLSAPGYLVVVLLFAALHGVAAMVGGRIGARASSRRATATALTHTLAETLRFSFPFGGIPLASLGIAQASSPLARLAPLGGIVLITYAAFRLAVGVHRTRILAGVVVLCAVAPSLSSIHSVGTRRIALVQGGGEQGTHAVNTDARVVFERHLAATQTIPSSDAPDMVIWPENVVDVEDFSTSTELLEIGEQARRLARPVVVGITEQTGSDQFTNAQVVVTPSGQLAGRYDKKRRVPFGEYMPLRGLLHALGAPTNLVPRNAIAGQSPAVLNVDGIPISVVISWEVFFGPRVNEGVSRGGEFIMNPTNGSSYTWTVLQTQQIASSRLRAREQSRWVAQVSPTGFTAFVSPSGRVIARTKVSEQRVVTQTIELRAGRTIYSRLGNSWVVIFFCAAFLIIANRDRRERARERATVRRMTTRPT